MAEVCIALPGKKGNCLPITYAYAMLPASSHVAVFLEVTEVGGEEVTEAGEERRTSTAEVRRYRGPRRQ
jgi:hypothetical protein